MTVFNTNYSSIEDAFGYLNPELQPKGKKKKNRDPICELYNSRAHQNTYTDADLVSYTNRYQEEKYNKAPYQSPSGMMGRESSPKYVDVSAEKNDLESHFDFQPTKYIQEEANQAFVPVARRDFTQDSRQMDPMQRRSVSAEVPRHEVVDREEYHDAPMPRYSVTDEERHYQPTYEERRRPVFEESHKFLDTHERQINWLDLILFIVCGTLLIFMMEQFVKVGQLLA